MLSYPKYEFYVLNYDFNAKKVVNFNIFRNYLLTQSVTDKVEEYLGGQLTIEELREEIRKSIAWQERGRREYEISVGDAFEEDCSKLEKWDCYEQAFPNIELITDMCITKYMKWVKEEV